MNVPIVDFRKIPTGATKLQIAQELAHQGHRIGPILVPGDNWPPYPLAHGLGSNPWVSATKDIESIAHFFKDENVQIGIASAEGGSCDWYVLSDHALRPLKHISSKPIVLSRIAPRERSTEYVKRKVPDILPAAARIDQVRRAIENIAARHDEIRGKIAAARSEARAHQTLVDERSELNSQIRAAEAAAYIDGRAADVTELSEKLSATEILIKKSSKNAEAASTAIKVMESKASALAAMLPPLRDDLEKANKTWRNIRRGELLENLREALHELHPTIAALLAVETSLHLHDRNTTWDWILGVSNATSSEAMRPDWLESSIESSYPGYQNAVDELNSAELNIEG